MKEEESDSSINWSELEKKCMRKFINTYKHLPQLWDPKNPHYTNKTQRNLAYDALLVIMQKWLPTATRFNVRQKINTLRSNYRKERRRVLNSKNIRSNGDVFYNYRPLSWKYYELQFLETIDEPVRDSLDLDLNDSTACEEGGLEGSDNNSTSGHDEQYYPDFKTESLSEPFESFIDHNKSRKRRVYDETAVNDVEDGEFKAIGANVAYKLKRMDFDQRSFAELLIHKVLLNGLRKNLSEDTDLTDLQVLDMKTFEEQ